MSKNRHYAPPYRAKTRRRKDATREFYPTRRRRDAAYFFFTLFVCLMLVLLAFAALNVDFSGRAMKNGDEPTLAFKVSQSGQAKLTLLGRDYFADVSFLSPVGEFMQKAENIAADRMPAALKLTIKAIPRLYEAASRAAAAVEEKLFEAAGNS